MQVSFDTKEELFSNRQDLQNMYIAYIAQGMERYVSADSADGARHSRPRQIATCIMEPVIQVKRLLTVANLAH